MANLNKELILERLSSLRENLKHLRELGRLPVEEFTSDFKAVGSAERLLQISIEGLI